MSRVKSKLFGLSNTSLCSTLAVSFHVARSFLALAVKTVNLLSALSWLILFQCSLTHHCLIYKRLFNIHVCLGDISQTLQRQPEIYWLCVLFFFSFVSICNRILKLQTCFISFSNCCLLHLNYLSCSLSFFVCLYLFPPCQVSFFFPLFLFFPQLLLTHKYRNVLLMIK